MARTVPPDQLLLRRVNTLCRWLPAAKTQDVKAVHQARVATRRLREALPVVASGKSRRALEKTARRLTRALGPVRELDVALQTLDALDTVGEVPRAAVARLRSLVGQDRRGLHLEMLRRLERSNIMKLKQRVTAAAQTPQIGLRRDETGARRPVVTAEARAGRRAARLRAAIEKASSIYLPARLHEVRIAVKRLRYALELQHELSGGRLTRPAAGSRSPRGAAARIRTLVEAQDLLGRMHDLEVLIDRTRTLQGSPAVLNLRLSADLDRLVRRLENECRQLHGRYMAARGAVLAVCDYAEAAVARRAEQRSVA